MSSKLDSNSWGMDLDKARDVISYYMNNGKQITKDVREAYEFFSGFGMKSYGLMKGLAGEEIAEEIVRLDRILNI